MIQSYVSGQAGKLAVRKGSLYQLHDLDSERAPKTINSNELRMLFANCCDVEQISSPTIDVALVHANNLADADCALRYFIILISPEASKRKALKEVVETLDWLLANSFALEVVRNNFFSHELPHEIDHNSIRNFISDFGNIDRIFDEIVSHQVEIKKVRAAFDVIPDVHFDSTDHKFQFKESAIKGGCFHKLATEPANSALFHIYKVMSKVPNSIKIIQEWTKQFEITHIAKKLDNRPEEDFGDDKIYGRARSGAGGRQAFENAKIQQKAILDKIRVGDVEHARRFAEDLVASQKQTSEPEHVAKSLCQLSQFAKEYQIYELELDWAEQATKIHPSDGRAHGQMGDALIRLHRYTEANVALEQASAFGEEQYAINGKARIQKATGNLDEAEKLFLELLERFPNDPSRVYGIAGLAEIARDRGDLERALEKYEQAIILEPHDPVFQNGLAATHAQMGNFSEALKRYQTSLSYGENEVVTLVGIASVYKTMGDFELAEEKFSEISTKFPHDPFSRSALGDLYRLTGRFEEAHKILKKACEDLPFSPQPLVSLAGTCSEWGRYAEAKEVHAIGAKSFPYEVFFATGLANSYRKSGQYALALKTYDAARQKFPSDNTARLGRADMLRRMGHAKEAAISYKNMLSENSSFLPASNGLASLLVHQGKYEEARQYLIERDPLTQDEWRSHIIRGMILVKQNEYESAEQFFSDLVRKTPFAREGRIMKAILASINIKRKNFHAALMNSESVDGEITELIRMHALAGANKMGSASEVLENFRSNSPEFFPEIREEIAAQFGMNDNQPKYDHHTLVLEEQSLLLLEAA